MRMMLKQNLSAKNKLYKLFSAEMLDVEFVAKDSTSLYNPVIELYSDEDITKYNYGYIEDWKRAYFINPYNVKVAGHNRYEVQLECDSLSTFADQLVGVPCIIDRTENYGGTPYLNSEAFVANCKHKTDIINFPSGLNDTGEFILITAGG